MAGRLRWRRTTAAVAVRLPTILFVFACLLATLAYGVVIGRFEVFPYRLIADAYRTAQAMRDSFARDALSDFRFTDIPAEEVKNRRVAPYIPADDSATFLVTGGRSRFLEYCPEFGCAAVILGRDGRLIHAYPFRPTELAEKRIVELPFENLFFDVTLDIGIQGLDILPNGDLIAVFNFENNFPYGGGVARLDRDGHVLWYRQDYTHHWPRITAQNEILVTASEMERDRVRYSFGNVNRFIDCPQGFYKDGVRVLSPDGTVKDEIPVFDALVRSRYAPHLAARAAFENPQYAACDPLHLNSVVPVGPALASKFSDVRAEDLLVSVRNLSALLIIGRSDHEIRHFFKGTFLSQHSPMPLPDGRIVLFDNLGASEDVGPSRVLIYDPATGEETTLFPNSAVPDSPATFSGVLGRISVSRDGQKLLVAFGDSGRGYEIRLADGAIVTAFDNLHDLRSVDTDEDEPNSAARTYQTGLYYVYPEVLSRL